MSDQTDWTGTVAAQQGQVALLANQTIEPTAGNHIDTPFTIPAGVKVNALLLVAQAAFAYGARVQVLGRTSNLLYYDGRPFANDSISPYVDASRFIVPFPGDYEAGGILRVSATGVQEGLQFGYLFGFEGVVPPYQQPPIPAALASFGFSSVSPGTILAAPNDGRQIRIWSALAACSQSTFAAGNAQITMTANGVDLMTVQGPTPVAQTFPQGFITPGPVLLVNSNPGGAGQGQGNIVYDYV